MFANAPQGPICQSCSMPMAKPGDFGTEADGKPSAKYCTYCYAKGSFTAPDISMEQMRDFCIHKVVEMGAMSRTEAEKHMYAVFPKLERWG